MTTPKEALELAKPLIDIMASNSAAGSFEAKRAIDEAIASLKGDAVERVARIINPDAFCSNPDPDEPEFWRKAARHLAREKARAILATGLVAGEAAIRADEREKCARIAGSECYATTGRQIAAAIRSGGANER